MHNRTTLIKRPRRSGLSRLLTAAAIGAFGWTLAGGAGLDFQLTNEAGAQAPPNGGDREGRGGRRGGQDGAQQDGQRGGRRGQQDGQQGGRGGGSMFGGGGGGERGGNRSMPGMRDIQEQLEPDFMRRDLSLFVDQLALDDAQMLVLETLFDDYETDYESGSTTVRDELESLGREMFENLMPSDMREQMGERFREMRGEIEEMAAEMGEMTREERREIFRDRMRQMQEEMQAERVDRGLADEAKASMTKIFDLFEAWLIEKAAMRVRFVDGLKSQLTDGQLGSWPEFDRFLVREKSLPRARLSGEGANLFLAIDEFGLTDEQFDKIEPTFDDYELALHEALSSRDRFLENSAPKMYRALQEGDTTGARRIVERQMDYRKSVRGVNDQFIDTFAAQVGELDSDTGIKFGRTLRGRAYERVFRATSTTRAFEAALQLELDAEVATAVTELFAAYGSELDSMNERIVNLTQKQEPERALSDVDRMASVMEGNFMGAWNRDRGDADNDVREAYEKRGELDETYYERLIAMLTPEQIEQLPSRGRNRGERGDRGDRGGDRGGEGDRGGRSFDLDAMPEQVRERIIERFDTDGDGELSETELEGIRERFQNRGGGPGGGGGGEGGRGGRGGRGGDSPV